MKTTIIFDLDGTLLNTLGDLRSAANETLRLRGLPPRTLEEIRAFVGNGLRKLMIRCMPEYTPDAEIDAALTDFKAYYSAHMRDATHPYPGIAELIDTLHARGIQMGVLSNKIDDAANDLVHHYFGEKIDVTVGERVGIPRKPDPTSCRMLMEQLGAQPQDVLYVGDSQVDMQTACNAGLTAVGVTWGFRDRALLEANGAAYLVDEPMQIAELLHKA